MTGGVRCPTRRPVPHRAETHASHATNAPIANVVLGALLLVKQRLHLGALLTERGLHLQLLLNGGVGQLVPTVGGWAAAAQGQVWVLTCPALCC